MGSPTCTYSHGVLINPANAVRYHESDDFNVNLNLGAVGSDEDELIDNADDLANQLDLLTTLSSSTSPAVLQDIEDTLVLLDGSDANVVVGGNITIGIPSSNFSAVFFVNVIGGVEVVMDVDSTDLDKIRALIEDPTNAPDINVETDLVSEITATGLVLREIGIGFGKEFDVKGQPIALGITPKHQYVETIAYTETVSNIDSDNFDAEQFTTDDSNLNLDLGISTHWNNVYAGLSVTNLISNDYATVNPAKTVRIETKTSAGFSYVNGWGNVGIDLDLNPVQYLGTDNDVQFVKLGAEVNIYRTVQLRMGYRHDLEDTLDDTVSVGVGLSPFDVVNLDIAALKGGDDTFGAAVQLGVSF
ncbi:MAG: conjugal transfer protein TraF [Motiliproteus sp.]